MKDIRIVCGANFGDEGKGLMTDYFSQKQIVLLFVQMVVLREGIQ